jgi:hypothetical protein
MKIGYTRVDEWTLYPKMVNASIIIRNEFEIELSGLAARTGDASMRGKKPLDENKLMNFQFKLATFARHRLAVSITRRRAIESNFHVHTHRERISIKRKTAQNINSQVSRSLGISALFTIQQFWIERRAMIAGLGSRVSDWWIEWTGQFGAVEEHGMGKANFSGFCYQLKVTSPQTQSAALKRWFIAFSYTQRATFDDLWGFARAVRLWICSTRWLYQFQLDD